MDQKTEIEAYAESMTEMSKFYHYFGSAVDYATDSKYNLFHPNFILIISYRFNW